MNPLERRATALSLAERIAPVIEVRLAEIAASQPTRIVYANSDLTTAGAELCRVLGVLEQSRYTAAEPAARSGLERAARKFRTVFNKSHCPPRAK